MSAEEMKIARAQMNETIRLAVEEFETDTGLRVSEIKMYRSATINGDSLLGYVTSEVLL